MGMMSLLFLVLFLLPSNSAQHDPFPEDWKCSAPDTLLGKRAADYYHLMGSSCKDLKEGLNGCCSNFSVCDERNGVNCVGQHEECNAEVVSTREEECFAVADRFVRKDRRYYPDKDWQCAGSEHHLGGRDQAYRDVIRGRCADFKDPLSQCCAKFNECIGNNGDLCITKHEKCNSRIVPKDNVECTKVAKKLINRDHHDNMPEEYFKNWKCQSNALGGREHIYQSLFLSSCYDLRGKLSECCEQFNNCSKEGGILCVAKHEKCNSAVVSGREKDCSDISDKLINGDHHDNMPEDYFTNWKCKSSALGGSEQAYRDVTSGQCAHFKDPLSQCCAKFNECIGNNGDLCIAKHEKCNSRIVPKDNVECTKVAKKLINRDHHDNMPEDYFKNWKCQSNALGAREHIYQSLFLSSCYDLRGKLSECCEQFNNCSKEGGILCEAKHEKCNSGVVSGREKDCSDIANQLINREEKEKEKEEPGRVVVYYTRVVIYARTQMVAHPLRFAIGLTLLTLGLVFLCCAFCCCCAPLTKKREKRPIQRSSSRSAYSVRSNSTRD